MMLIIDEYKDFYFSLSTSYLVAIYQSTPPIQESDVIATANLMANISLSFLTCYGECMMETCKKLIREIADLDCVNRFIFNQNESCHLQKYRQEKD